MECHKQIDKYSVRVKVWHTEGVDDDTLCVFSSEKYFKDSEPCERSDVPPHLLERFDSFADDCYWDYIEDLEVDEVIGEVVKS